MAEHRLLAIPADQVDTVWPQVRGPLAKAIGDRRSCIDDVLLDVLRRDAQLWLVLRGEEVRAALVTRELRYPRGRSLLIQLLAGQGLGEWVHLLAELERHARELGCDAVEIQGRRAWERVLPGYTVVRTVLAKEV